MSYDALPDPEVYLAHPDGASLPEVMMFNAMVALRRRKWSEPTIKLVQDTLSLLRGGGALQNMSDSFRQGLRRVTSFLESLRASQGVDAMTKEFAEQFHQLLSNV